MASHYAKSEFQGRGSQRMAGDSAFITASKLVLRDGVLLCPENSDFCLAAIHNVLTYIPSPRSQPGIVYFVITTGKPSWVKIGFANRHRVWRRLHEIQCMCPYSLNFWFCLEGSIELEKRLHRTFRRFRGFGEWFYAHNTIRAFGRIVKKHPELFASYSAIDDINWKTEF